MLVLVLVPMAITSLPMDATWTLVDLVRRQARIQPDRVAVEFEHGTSLTYAEMDAASDRVARGLAGLGVSEGDRVLSLVKNRVEFITFMFGTLKLGAIWVPINTELKGAFLEHQLRNSDPSVAITEPSLLPAFEGVATLPDAALTTLIVVAGDTSPALPPVFDGLEVINADDLDPHAVVVDFADPTPHDIAMICYTSGTTGPSKGVLLPQAHCYLFGLGLSRRLGLGDDDRYFICMPLFHVNALLMQVIGTFIAGAYCYIVERFSATTWLDDLRRTGATITNGLGVIPEFIFRQPPTPRDADHDCKAIMAVPISDDWATEFRDRFGMEIIQGFGMTECNIPFYTKPTDPLIGGLAGHLLEEWFEAAIVDPETDEPLPPNTVGELVIRPKIASCFMAGYYRMPDKTVEAWRNLWFHTGDACRFDDEGRMFFVDRIKDCIRRRGENISSYELEQVLNAHPDVGESAVVGIRVEGAGGEDEVKALVVPAPGVALDWTVLLEHCAARVPRFAVPRFFEQIAEVPKTSTGKVQKQQFKAAGVTAETWDRDSIGYVVPRG